MTDSLIKVLIAEDSKVMEIIFKSIFTEENGFEIVGCAVNGIEACELTKKRHPDVITMDIEMPEMNGYEATEVIMTESPTPIVVISSFVKTLNLNVTFNALNAGALAVIDKPVNVNSDEFESQKEYIIRTVKAMSEVHVVRRRKPKKISKPVHEKSFTGGNNKFEIIAIGCSTGGPEALKTIISGLPANLPVPIVIVQHISHGFIDGLVSWLKLHTALDIELISASKQRLLPGKIYFAADDKHLLIKNDTHPIALFDDSPPINHFKPSVTPLFSSLATEYPGTSAAGLLTGMGRDGADGLLEMKQAGCHTFIQDELSSIVFGMPGAAKELNAQNDIVPLDNIADFIVGLLKEK